ncbi:MAG: nuclear transport factor 2 family protein [Pyrinomonadaceae bacterium]
MKRLLALAALLVAASSACTTTTNTNTGAGNNTGAGSNANAAASPAPAAGPTLADIEARERQSWEHMKSKNWDAFAATLADDFVFVGAPGVIDKAGTLAALRQMELLEYTLSDFRFVKVDADLAVVTYTATDKSTFEGKQTGGKPIRNSSAWANRGGKWLNVYHQESDVLEVTGAQPTPSPAASPVASPAATPAASPAASPAAVASATDAEKAVWEAIKSKNADAFRSYLLPDALEVEPEGVFDTETSVRMVMTSDAPKFTPSDFKETKIDPDATLLTYKTTGPERGRTVEMYHSTIWTQRGGQWKAAFHQGTYAQTPGPQ